MNIQSASTAVVPCSAYPKKLFTLQAFSFRRNTSAMTMIIQMS